MTGRDATTSFAATLVDEWARAGVTDAVVSPGSRSAPLALALARDGRLARARRARRAFGRVPRVGARARVRGGPRSCCARRGPRPPTSIRPSSRRRTRAFRCSCAPPTGRRSCATRVPGRPIDQTHLYGDAARWFCDPGPPGDEPERGRHVACACESRGCRSRSARPPGPVHLNLPFREPLLPTGARPVDAPGPGRWPAVDRARRPQRACRDAADVERLAELVRATPARACSSPVGVRRCRPATATRFAAAAGWPVLADPISQLRTGPHAISTYEALLRAPGFADAHRPDLVVRVGAPLTSKVATGVARSVDPAGARRSRRGVARSAPRGRRALRGRRRGVARGGRRRVGLGARRR